MLQACLADEHPAGHPGQPPGGQGAHLLLVRFHFQPHRGPAQPPRLPVPHPDLRHDHGAALYDFRDDPPTTIFLLSMRSGAVGLNLTQANHVILMDLYMNKQLEYQAVGRVHRLGQRREVKIYRLACLGTVEERILQMHSAGEMVSAEGTAGSLREDRVTLCKACYRSLLGLALKEDAAGMLEKKRRRGI